MQIDRGRGDASLWLVVERAGGSGDGKVGKGIAVAKRERESE